MPTIDENYPEDNDRLIVCFASDELDRIINQIIRLDGIQDYSTIESGRVILKVTAEEYNEVLNKFRMHDEVSKLEVFPFSDSEVTTDE